MNLSTKTAYLMLGSRLFLFLFFQAAIAWIANSWEISSHYWLLTATLTNFVSILLLYFLFRRDGIVYWRIFSLNRATLKKDILLFLGLTLAAGPLVFITGALLSKSLWGDPDVPTRMLFVPIDKWLIYILMLAFPLTIALAELATYFVYIMSKLKEQVKLRWLAVLLPVLFLSLQHCTLPFIPDMRFILYRGLAFLPFAALIGISLYYRPSLFPYFAVLHGIMDFATALMFLVEV